MTKQRKSPTIQKPVFDEATALRFAAASSQQVSEAKVDSLPKSTSKKPAAKTGSCGNIGKDMQQISFTISKALYNKIAKEATRKDRTVEEHLKKHLVKIYDK
jgi:hypothetical protein